MVKHRWLALALVVLVSAAARAQEDGSGSDAAPAVPADGSGSDAAPAVPADGSGSDAAPAADSASSDGSGSDSGSDASSDSSSGSGLSGPAAELAKQAFEKLPFLKELLAKAKLSTCGDKCVQTTHQGVTAYIFYSKSATHALLVPQGGGLKMAGSAALVSKIFGDAKVPAAALIVSQADATIDTSSLTLPGDVGKLISDANGGDANVSVTKGAAVFATLVVGKSGVLGQVAKAVGVVGQPIRVNGSIDADALRGLFGKGSKGSRSLTIALPQATPMPFAKINDKSLFHLVTNSTKITVAGEEGTLKVDGQIDATVWVRGKEMKMPIALTATKSASGFDVKLDGKVTPPDGKDALGVGLPVKMITVSLASAGQKGSKADTQLQLGATVTLNKRDLVAAIDLQAPGGKLSEVSVSLTDGELTLGDLPKLKNLPGAAEFKLSKPSFGIHVATKEAYLSGDFAWAKKNITAKAVLLFKEKPTASATLLIDSPGISLAQLAPSLKLPEEMKTLLKLPKGLISITTEKSTAPSSKHKASDLPLPAKAMLEAIAGAGKDISLPQGFALSGKLDPETASPKVKKILQKLGVKGPMLLSGSLQGVLPPSGSPSINVTADLATFEIPTDKQPKGFKLKSVAPKFFIAAKETKTGPDVELGIETDLGLQIGKQDLPPLIGKIYAQLSAAEQAIRFSGKMQGEWSDPLGLRGIAIADTVMAFGFDSTSAVHLALGGKAKFSPTMDYELAMILDITTGTGIPTPQKAGLLFKAKEISPAFPFILMEKLAVSAVNGPMAAAFKDAKLKAAMQRITALKTPMHQSHGKKLPLDALKFVGVGDQPATLYLATPGVQDPDLPAFDGAGIKIIAAADFMGHRLGSVDARLTPADGFELHATVSDFGIPKSKPMVSLKNAKLDLKAPVPGPGIKDGYLKMSGNSQVLLFKGALDVEIDAQMAKFEMDNDWGPIGKAHFKCASIGPLSHPTDFSLGMQIQATGLKNIGKKLHEAVQKHAAEEKAKLAEKLNIPKTQSKIDNDKKALHDLKAKKHKSPRDDEKIVKDGAELAKLETELKGKQATLKADSLVWDAMDELAKAGNISIDDLELIDARLVGAMKGDPVTVKAKMQIGKKKIDGTFKFSLMKPGEMNLKELAMTVAKHLEQELKPHKK